MKSNLEVLPQICNQVEVWVSAPARSGGGLSACLGVLIPSLLQSKADFPAFASIDPALSPDQCPSPITPENSYAHDHVVFNQGIHKDWVFFVPLTSNS